MLSLRVNRIFPYISIIFAAIALIFLQKQYLEQYIKANNQTDYFQQEKQLKALLDVQKNLPTFGFDNLVADWQFLQFIQYFGDNTAREKTGYPLVADYFEIISNYDPRFVQGYLMLSVANSIYAGRPDLTVPLMNKVLKSMSPKIPLSNFVWTYKGVDEILFLGDIPAAKHSYEMGAQWALASGDEAGKIIAARNRETVQFLEANPDSKKAQAGAWASILTSAFDDKTRNRAIQEIRKLGGDVIITPEGKLEIKLPEID